MNQCPEKGAEMARGSKAKYTSKQKRQAKHIEDSAKKEGRSAKTAARIAWATVNKETGGAGKSVRNTSPSKKGGRKGGKAASHRTTKEHSAHASH
jgi:hypothetical protein